jgi:hypothetical protein
MRLYKNFLAIKNKPLIFGLVVLLYIIFQVGRIFVNYIFTEFSTSLNLSFLFLIFGMVSLMILIKYK